ncbi:MAG: acylphosphatase [Chlamydiales bacterium]
MDNTSSNLRELHAIMKGEVQGVFFRATTKEFAENLGLAGTVQNLPDGTVEIKAQGEEDKLKKLVQQLIDEYRLDSKNGAEVKISEPSRSFNGFHIVK